MFVTPSLRNCSNKYKLARGEKNKKCISLRLSQLLSKEMSFQLLLEDWQGSSIQDRGRKIIPPARNREISTIYTVWMVIYRNSNVNILIVLDTDFCLLWAVSSNHHNKNKKTFVVFYFKCNDSKIYESWTFWNKLQDKINFFTIF